MLAGAALLALRLDSQPGWRVAFPCFLVLGALPGLGVRFVPAGIVVGVVAARALWRSRPRSSRRGCSCGRDPSSGRGGRASSTDAVGTFSVSSTSSSEVRTSPISVSSSWSIRPMAKVTPGGMDAEIEISEMR